MTATLDTAPYTRLHITPLDPDLLKVVISTSILPRARNISYHSLETFPEKRYGFVELPGEDADKVRNKLNGSVVKGVKIRIQQARPESRPAPLGEEAMAREKGDKKRARGGEDGSKKRKRTGEELPGIELEAGRKVKRGWTVPADEQKSRGDKNWRDKEKGKEKGKDKDRGEKEARREIKSKYTDLAECLIKTRLPSRAHEEDAEAGVRKRKKKDKEVVVHEFEKTTKFPSFLRSAKPDSSKRKTNLEFVDGKGWVDEDGNVVEAVKSTRPKASAAPIPASRTAPKKLEQKQDSTSPGGDEPSSEDSHDEASHSGQSNSQGSNQEEGAGECTADATCCRAMGTDSATVQEEAESAECDLAPSPPPATVSEAPRPESSGSSTGLTIRIPAAAPEVHPLEALYKRPSGEAAAPGAEAFSFFGGGDSGEDSDEQGKDEGARAHAPMTPFTRQDFDARGIRSAAPTPDTAFPRRGSKLWPGEQEDEDEDGDEEGGQGEDDEGGDRGGEGLEKQPTSDFQKWFWENRGELNRAWKKRRKTAAKEKRYRENKARADRAI